MIIDVHIHILSKQEIALGAEQSARRVGDRKEEEARPRAVSGYWARTLTVNVIRPAHWGRPAPLPYIVIPSRIGASAPSTRRDVCHRVRAIAPNPPPRTSQRQRVGRSEILPNNPTVQWARLACVRM